jgi:LuxR family maltose regulon positive regulatory protein
MKVPLVETKLFVPPSRPGVVARPRLIERLARGQSHDAGRLVLVSAPAGFGKTTLVRTWLTGPDNEADTVAWVSLDEGDQNASTFWMYVVAALDRAAPGVGAGALPLLRAGQEPTEELLAGLLNELSVLPGEVTLVLDDYHLADGPGVRPGMSFLLDHLPPQVHLVISTRADPALPLARLRARGELTEVRAADLRFTTDEAGTYLNDCSGLNLTAGDIGTLEERTEGWVAALQLAALSLHGREDASGFIAGFAGDDRYVVDYLLEEVLDRQPEPVRRFLLETSILDQLTGRLCDAVTCETGGKAMLERLDRANLFLVPLDDQRRWYRYHHLFGALLRSRLTDEHGAADGGIAELHRRASRWYDQAGDPVPAVRHAVAAGDTERAAELVELAVPRLRRNRQEATLCQWISDLPDDVVERRPVLAMGFVGALMANNDFEDVERRLNHIEQTLNTQHDADTSQTAGNMPSLVVVDEEELARLPGEIELYRAGLALLGGDPAATLDHARRAVDMAPTHDDLTRASAAALFGLASWTTGDLEAAHRGYTDAADGLRRLGYVSDVLGCTVTLADLETTHGRLRQAQQSYQRALDLATDEHQGMRGVRDMHTGLAQLAVERNDLTTAHGHLRRCDELGEAAGLPQNPYRWRLAMALLREAEGEPDTALALLADAERVYVADFQPSWRPISALRARMLATHGDLPAALDWARQHAVSVDDDLSYLREYEHVTLARVLLAQHAADGSPRSLADAVGLLQRLLAAAEGAGRTGTAIEVLALQGLAHQAAGEHAEALAVTERALTMAEPEGYVRVFAMHGEPLAALLSALDQRRPDWPYLGRILDATRSRTREWVAASPPASGRPAQDRLIDPLTDRERDVMRLLASELDGPAIARELVLSLNTVRTHTKNIYAKLGVTSRRAAVTRAYQLNLLSRTSPR